MLEVKNLEVVVDGKILLKDFTILVKKGESHVIMGPNGAGKSTFLNVIAGHPKYKVKKGKILYEGRDLLKVPVEKRAISGIFSSFQYPIEIATVSNFEFLFSAYNLRIKEKGKKILDRKAFEKILKEKMKLFNMKKEFLERGINKGFSGGERKKNEILQMSLFSPKLSILDEIDSGLDVDSLKVIAKIIEGLRTTKNSIILITHYKNLLRYINPDFVHILKGGKIVKTGGKELANQLEKKGYDGVK